MNITTRDLRLILRALHHYAGACVRAGDPDQAADLDALHDHLERMNTHPTEDGQAFFVWLARHG